MVPSVWLLSLGCGEAGPTTIRSEGSETMREMLQQMSAAHHAVDPLLVVDVRGGGSETGIRALLDGKTDLAASSRPITAEEKAAAKANGFELFETVVAFDGVTVLVNQDNPIASITFGDLKCIYSDTGTCTKWSDVGVTIDCGGNDTIVKHGRERTSGTWEFFREAALGFEGRFGSVNEHATPQPILEAVGADKCAIGYTGMVHHAEGVRVVCLSDERGHQCAEPTSETVKSGAYVLARPLYLYSRGEPQGAIGSYLEWVTGDAGQRIAADVGFVPLR